MSWCPDVGNNSTFIYVESTVVFQVNSMFQPGQAQDNPIYHHSGVANSLPFLLSENQVYYWLCCPLRLDRYR